MVVQSIGGYGRSVESLLGLRFGCAIVFAPDDGASGGNGGGEAPAPEPENETEKVMNALKKERELRAAIEKETKTLKAQLQAFGDVDPELAKKAKQVLAQQEELAQIESRIKAEADQEYQPRIQQVEQAKAAIEQELINFKLDTMLEREYGKANGFPGEYEVIASKLRSRVQFDPKTNTVKVLDKSGNAAFENGKPMAIAALIAELKQEDMGFARHFKGTDASGVGLTGNGQSGTIDPAYANMPDWAQVELMRRAK